MRSLYADAHLGSLSVAQVAAGARVATCAFAERCAATVTASTSPLICAGCSRRARCNLRVRCKVRGYGHGLDLTPDLRRLQQARALQPARSLEGARLGTAGAAALLLQP
ncbi:hypothetical protein DK926_07860 [Rhodococcus sp. Eu-32]|uniref:hypothetical protein n=1 Tax=Rhodococcus sp. Eu-32 TaxID=1017319 RepID=UPI000DF1EC2A|nr:hypothetical protein [Rhodococcus sp. Eu-32]RRQ28307.1 hypothetical protein DK926_07860 [Rhodococcus sp. Eu-32]